ncbi:hypothetical protein [Arthrobacter sp. IK3]|uniref:hypothetical protein n=1 Tax=Arthrobacter sp. IK3 TaxID=3448169 RepID=UPI003EE09535
MIDWNKYQAEALTTAVFPLDRGLDYTVLGLVSEVGEVVDLAAREEIPSRRLWEKWIKAEIGDCFWYAAAVADALGTTLQAVWDARAAEEEYASYTFTAAAAVIQAGLMAGHLKKAIRDDGGVLLPARRAAMIQTLGKVVTELTALCSSLDTTVHAVTQANLNKLADRKQRGVLQGSGDNR